ncbi:MAG: hypothetical protein J5685_08160 [Clostridiales bacterium]|nr:hypothetical protein [Clostridiales bacterium]
MGNKKNKNYKKKKKKQKQVNKRTRNLIRIAVAAAVVIILCVIFGFKHIVTFAREQAIKKDLKAVYPDGDIVKIECDMEPTDVDRIIENLHLAPGSLPQTDIYYCRIIDSEDQNWVGLADKDGHVYYDSYVNGYFADQLIAYFNETVDPADNLPGLEFEYHVFTYENQARCLPTGQIHSFAEYIDPDIAGWGSTLAQGYPALWVGVSDNSRATLDAIDACFEDSDCEVYIIFYEAVTGDNEKIYSYFPYEQEADA